MSDVAIPEDMQDVAPKALSRWDNEGGASETAAQEPPPHAPDVTNAELVLLRVRVIALENLLIAVLAEGSDRQRQAARDMAAIIAPRVGCTQHPLTLRAAQHMTDLVDRAVQSGGGSRLPG